MSYENSIKATENMLKARKKAIVEMLKARETEKNARSKP